MSGDVIHSASYHQAHDQDSAFLGPVRRLSDRYGLRGLLALTTLFSVSIGGYGLAYFLLVWLA